MSKFRGPGGLQFPGERYRSAPKNVFAVVLRYWKLVWGDGSVIFAQMIF